MDIKQKLISEGRLSADGRNKQALFFDVDPSIPSWPDGMTVEEEGQYIKERRLIYE